MLAVLKLELKDVLYVTNDAVAGESKKTSCAEKYSCCADPLYPKNGKEVSVVASLKSRIDKALAPLPSDLAQ